MIENSTKTSSVSASSTASALQAVIAVTGALSADEEKGASAMLAAGSSVAAVISHIEKHRLVASRQEDEKRLGAPSMAQATAQAEIGPASPPSEELDQDGPEVPETARDDAPKG